MREYMKKRSSIKINYSKMSSQQLKTIHSETQSSLWETMRRKKNIENDYEISLKKKREYDRLIERCNRIKSDSYNRLTLINKMTSKLTNPPLNQDEAARLLEINKKTAMLNYKDISNPYQQIQQINNYQQTLRDRIAKLEELIKKKEETEARLTEKKEELKAKRTQERAIIASAQGKPRQAANTIKSVLKKKREIDICPYCDRPVGKNPHCDHIHPISHGGLSTLDNMVYICSSCNIKKKDLTLREFIVQNGLKRDHIEKNLLLKGKRI